MLTCDFNRCSMGQLIAQPIEWDTSVVSSKTAIQRFIDMLLESIVFRKRVNRF